MDMPLKSLDLSGCVSVSDIRPLRRLSRLTELNLARCLRVRDLSPLQDVPLESIDISGTRVDNINALDKIPTLVTISR